MRVVRKLKRLTPVKNIDDSGLVTSKQAGVHPQLESCVRKHLDVPWLQPLHTPTVETFSLLEKEGVFSDDLPIILDSGCGTGSSTQKLAAMFPGHLVIGADRSLKRLAKSGLTTGFVHSKNCILVRAELATFWRLLLNRGISPERHYLLYPNPSPKPGHLSRRWHGHPVFPQLLRLGGEIELRCNWEIYAMEFAEAVQLATGANMGVIKIQPDEAISPFEQKYFDRGQSLYSVTVPALALEAFRRSQADHALSNTSG